MNIMKRGIRFFVMMALIFSFTIAGAQSKIDQGRMDRDIEVAENILSTLIKQQFEKRSFFPMEINGEYREGYGVIFKLPTEMNGPMIWNFGGQAPGVTMLDGDSYSFSFSMPSGEQAELERIMGEDQQIKTEIVRGTGSSRGAARAATGRRVNIDSIREVTSDKILDAGKDFMANYGDLITQLPANEKIVITNRGEGDRMRYSMFAMESRPSYMSMEVTKEDITSYKQGKLSREQFDKKIKVVNSVMDDELQPDLELLTSIFNRLYRPDLSKTFFTEDNIYYERMKDYGAIYYMQVYSSNQSDFSNRRYIMPTIGLDNLDQAARDKKVKELYPQFEKDIEADILEYGKTVKSLKPEEQLIFNIRLTRCDACGIPSSLEISVKSSVLMDYASGKLNKDTALGRLTIKKGPFQ
jgi:hypothetical protein